jgi:hypothetical protein
MGHILGFIITKSNITIDPLKVQAISELPPPHNLHQLQSLHGKSNFLRRFISDYTTNSHGFLCLLHFNTQFVWDDEAQQSFDVLKRALDLTPLISSPDFEKYFFLYISTSNFVIYRVLVQDGFDGCEHIIYYVSKNLSQALLVLFT